MRNLKIRNKLLILVVLLLAGLASVGIASIFYMEQINKGSTVISENWLPSVIAAEELNTLTSDYRINEFAHVVSQDSGEMQEYETQMASVSSQIDHMFDQYRLVITNDTDRKLIESARTAWDEYLVNHDEMITLSRENKTSEAMKLINGESKELFDKASSTFLEIVNFNKTGADQASKDGDALYGTARTMMTGVILAIAVIGVVGALYIIRSIVSPVKEIDQVARKIADGKLDESITYQSKDELGQLATNFNATVTRLRD